MPLSKDTRKRPRKRSLDPAARPRRRPGWKRRVGVGTRLRSFGQGIAGAGRGLGLTGGRVAGGLLALAGAALAVGLWRRWGHRVRATVRDVDAPSAEPEPIPAAEAARPDLQPPEEGTGPLYHRRYRVDIEHATLTPEALIRRVGDDPDACTAVEIARFEKTKGKEGRLAVGDEFHVHLHAAPWDGPVRVVRCTPRSFTLATREGHMEAGQITFSAEIRGSVPGALRFTIESWARSRDAWVHFAYDTLGVARKGQEAMWTFFCERAAEASGGTRVGEIAVLTERAPDPDATDETEPDADQP